MQDKKAEIRFKNLPSLLNDLKKKKWVIDSFLFTYNRVNYVVILKLYKENARKPSKYSQAEVEFIERGNNYNLLLGHIDFYEVYFRSIEEFCNFFNVKRGSANRNLFLDFSEIFAEFIPNSRNEDKSDEERRLIGSRAEGNNPNAIYCYEVRRNGRYDDGTPHVRSIENSNKTQSLRPALYRRYCDDTNLSFCFSDEEEKEKSDDEIIANFASH
jgi:hypothetical protein